MRAWLALAFAGCGPDHIATSGGDETGGEAIASAHWLLYSARTDDPFDSQLVSLRAVDLGGLVDGVPLPAVDRTGPGELPARAQLSLRSIGRDFGGHG